MTKKIVFCVLAVGLILTGCGKTESPVSTEELATLTTQKSTVQKKTELIEAKPIDSSAKVSEEGTTELPEIYKTGERRKKEYNNESFMIEASDGTKIPCFGNFFDSYDGLADAVIGFLKEYSIYDGFMQLEFDIHNVTDPDYMECYAIYTDTSRLKLYIKHGDTWIVQRHEPGTERDQHWNDPEES